ncbi:MAG: DHH family phosphoesterase [Candidatus Altiarchaeota archaeon]|nr:DHH family phosphoesterase [Candidatus Altiarchaeota archaeon]
MKSEQISKELWDDIKLFSERLRQEKDVLVVSHHDADGITACAILLDLFSYLKIKTDSIITKQLDSRVMERIKGIERSVVFSDMGSGQLNLIRESGVDYYIIDHHKPMERDDRQVNPHFYGYDGGRDVAGAGMAYFVAKSLGRVDMAHLALVGAVGDMQDSSGSLHSLNRIILEDAVKQKTVKVKNDLRLFGRQSRSVHLMLTYASDPIIPGLTGNQQACMQFIESLGINPKRDNNSWKSYVDLSLGERKKLISALYMRLLDFNVPEYLIQGMVGEVYTLLREEKRSELRDSKEYATLMNACGRQERAEIGLAVCLGDREGKWDEARELLQSHREMLRRGIQYLSNSGVNKRAQLYYFNAGGEINERIIGVVAGMAYGAKIIPPNKPILAFALDREDPEMMKVSARANWTLVRRGIRLGDAMRKSSRKFGGEGGGHDIAAGATVPKKAVDSFIEAVNDIFEKQLTGG